MSLNNFAWVENLKEQPFIPCVITFDKDLLCTQSFYIACLALMSAHMQFCLGYMQNNGDDCQCTQWRSSQICCSPGKLLQCLNPRYHHMRWVNKRTAVSSFPIPSLALPLNSMTFWSLHNSLVLPCFHHLRYRMRHFSHHSLVGLGRILLSVWGLWYWRTVNISHNQYQGPVFNLHFSFGIKFILYFYIKE